MDIKMSNARTEGEVVALSLGFSALQLVAIAQQPRQPRAASAQVAELLDSYLIVPSPKLSILILQFSARKI